MCHRIHKLAGKHPPHTAPVLHIRNTLISEPSQVATELAAYFSSHLSPHFYFIKTAKECTPSPILILYRTLPSPFSSAELLSALLSCHNTHKDLDCIHYHPYTIKNNIWTIGNFPHHWLEALILPFLETNKYGTLP